MAKVRVEAAGGGLIDKAVKNLLSFSDDASKKALRDARATPGGAGRASVRRGDKGVEAVSKSVTANGGRFVGREVTVVAANGNRVRIDMIVNVNGRRVGIEVKNGPKAKHTPNQETGYPSIATAGGTPRGKRAEGAQWPPGTPIPPLPIYTVWL